MSACVFCEIFAGRAPANVLSSWGAAWVIEPLNPVTPGHVLVIPTVHVADFTEDPTVSAAVMRHAALYARRHDLADTNLITSRGRAATQSVFHLHLHLIPRRYDDRLALPWHSGKHSRGAKR